MLLQNLKMCTSWGTKAAALPVRRKYHLLINFLLLVAAAAKAWLVNMVNAACAGKSSPAVTQQLQRAFIIFYRTRRTCREYVALQRKLRLGGILTSMLFKAERRVQNVYIQYMALSCLHES